MAKVLVRIDLGQNTTTQEILDAQQGKGKLPEWFDNGRIIIDEAYLSRFPDDDSFFDFEFVSVEE